MKLKKSCINIIKKDKRLKNRLCFEMNTSPESLRRWSLANADNGPLTTFLAISIIKEEKGLQDSEILEGQELETV